MSNLIPVSRGFGSCVCVDTAVPRTYVEMFHSVTGSIQDCFEDSYSLQKRCIVTARERFT